MQPGDPFRRQITGPFQLDAATEYVDNDDNDNDDNDDDDDDEKGLRRIRGHPFEMTEEDKRVILSCLAHQHRRGPEDDDSIRRTLSAGSFATPQYRVEICAKGLEDDDTLDGIMTEKLREEQAKAKGLVAGLFRARSGGSKSSSAGILATIRRSSGSVVSSLSGHVGGAGRASLRGHGNGGAGHGPDDADTLDEFMAREEFKEEDRLRRLRRVGSGILESLDRLRRSHSFLLDRNDLWLKRSLEAIEAAKPTYLSPRMDGVRGFLPPASHPRDIVVKRPAAAVVVKRPGTPPAVKRPASPTVPPISSSPTLWETIGGAPEEPSTPPLIEKIQDKIEEMFPRCTVAVEPLPAVLTPPLLSASAVEDDDDPISLSPVPQEDDASVALIEVVVHYLTCGHVLREQELKQSPRISFPALATAFCSDSPIMMPHLDESNGRQGKFNLQRRREPQRRGLCASTECVGDDDEYDEDDEEFDDDEDRTYLSDYDDGTLEGSLRHRSSKKLWTAINSAFARSSTETTCEEKKGSK